MLFRQQRFSELKQETKKYVEMRRHATRLRYDCTPPCLLKSLPGQTLEGVFRPQFWRTTVVVMARVSQGRAPFPPHCSRWGPGMVQGRRLARTKRTLPALLGTHGSGDAVDQRSARCLRRHVRFVQSGALCTVRRSTAPVGGVMPSGRLFKGGCSAACHSRNSPALGDRSTRAAC